MLHSSWDYIGETIDVESRFSGHQHKTNAAGGHLYLLLNGLFTESVLKDKGFVLEAKAFFSGGLHSIKRRLNAVSAVQTLKIKLLYGRYSEGREATNIVDITVVPFGQKRFPLGPKICFRHECYLEGP